MIFRLDERAFHSDCLAKGDASKMMRCHGGDSYRRKGEHVSIGKLMSC